MTTPYSPSGTFPTFPINLPDDGEVISFATLMQGIIEPLIDGVGYVKDNGASSSLTTQADATWSGGAIPMILGATNITSNTFTNLSGSQSHKTIDLAIGDTVIVFATVIAVMDDVAHRGYLRIGNSVNSLLIPGACGVLTSTTKVTVNITGLYTASVGATYDFYVMGAVDAGTMGAPAVVSIQYLKFKA